MTRRLAFALALVLALPAVGRQASSPVVTDDLRQAGTPVAPLTFDELLSRAAAHRAELTMPAEVIGNEPSIRFETTGNVSRSQDLFIQSPYENRSTAAVVAVDYPLFDANSRRLANRIAANEAAQARQSLRMSDAEFETLLDAYADLWLTGAEVERTDAISRQVIAFADRAPELLQRGLITNITATQWQEQALALRARVLDMQLARLDSATKIHELIGDDDPNADITARIDFHMLPTWAVDIVSAVDNSPEVIAANERVERAQLAVQEVEARRRPDIALSGFAGVAAADARVANESSNGAFGVYGLRVRLSYTLRDRRAAADLSRARRELARVQAERDGIERRVRMALTAQMLRVDAQRKRIELLTQAVDLANRRHESLVRLAAAGVQSEFEALLAEAEAMSRETRLDEARIDQWKAWQRLRRLLPAQNKTAVMTAMIDVARYAMP
jgi:outer membrane protein TolC